ncbi:MAG: DHHW family protein [Clostridiales bacterium]|nr:DHHW family protein [Clostridiales bacterium]
MERLVKRGRDKGTSYDAGNAAMAAAFLLLMFAFAAAGQLLPDRAFSPQENRYLTLRPALSWGEVRSAAYMSDVEEYMTDQFPGRDYWVSAKALLQKMSGQKENNGVYLAADGYLIGKPDASPADIADQNLAVVLAMKAAGYDVALLVSPMAAEVLRGKLPPRAYTPEQAELLDKLRTEAPGVFVDVEPALRRAATEGLQVFFRTDHHWTATGAYQAYEAYMAWLGEAPVPAGGYDEKAVSVSFRGTLWSKSSLPFIAADRISIYEPKPQAQPARAGYTVEYFDGADTWTTSSVYQDEFLSRKDQYAYFLGQNQPLVVIRRGGATDAATGKDAAGAGSAAGTTADSPAAGADAAATAASTETAQSARKLMIFKDSYAHCFVPFLLPHFDEIHLADLRYWKRDPIAYMEEHGIQEVLFLYNADDFGGDRSISQAGAYLALH